jgi:hypothetical protein
MDLNQLLREHQLSLMRLDQAVTSSEREAHSQFVRHYAKAIASQKVLRAASVVLKSGLPIAQPGHIVVTPGERHPFRTVITFEGGTSTQQTCSGEISENPDQGNVASQAVFP